jgi:NAD(P)-dependent dehydrogenase (short-subunit alcohol dehydrogenase family)
MLPAGTFAGKVVAITGGGTGLGRAFGLEFARLGATVAILSRNEEHRQRGVCAIESVGGKAIQAPLDVRDAPAVAAAFDGFAEGRFRRQRGRLRRRQYAGAAAGETL